jgi:RNA polymerase sigma factor for flagellar operon FliA
MLDREAAEALFLEHLDWIDKVAAISCARSGIRGAVAEDFASQVRMKLLEDDYGIIRRFAGNSGLRTYLATVVTRQLVDFQRGQGGRWRASAAAERIGPPAPELERLVRREGYTLQQAGEKLRTAGRTTLSDAGLARLLGQFPERAPLRPEVQEPATGMGAAPGVSRADERVTEAEAGTRRADMLGALQAALKQLDEEDQLVMRLHFAEGQTVADVARALRLDQKSLYRRVERLRVRLRKLLESAGLSGDDVRGLLHEDDEP